MAFSNPFGDYSNIDLASIYASNVAAGGNGGGTSPGTPVPAPTPPGPGAPYNPTPAPVPTPPQYPGSPTGGPTVDDQGNILPGVPAQYGDVGFGNQQPIYQDPNTGQYFTGQFVKGPDGKYTVQPVSSNVGYTPDGTVFSVGRDYSAAITQNGLPAVYSDQNGFHQNGQTAPYGGDPNINPQTIVGYKPDGTPWYYGGGENTNGVDNGSNARLQWYLNGFNPQNLKNQLYNVNQGLPTSVLSEDELNRLAIATHEGQVMNKGVMNNNGNVIASRVANGMNAQDWGLLTGAEQQAYESWLNAQYATNADAASKFYQPTQQYAPNSQPANSDPYNPSATGSHLAPTGWTAPAVQGNTVTATGSGTGTGTLVNPGAGAPPSGPITPHQAGAVQEQNHSAAITQPAPGGNGLAGGGGKTQSPTQPYNPIVSRVGNMDQNAAAAAAAVRAQSPQPVGVQFITQADGSQRAEAVPQAHYG